MAKHITEMDLTNIELRNINLVKILKLPVGCHEVSPNDAIFYWHYIHYKETDISFSTASGAQISLGKQVLTL